MYELPEMPGNRDNLVLLRISSPRITSTGIQASCLSQECRMRISVSNFKAIKDITSFSLKRINILTGVNSGGKSSLIHLLLLIKQSLESRSSETPLKLNKPYVSLGKFENILRKRADCKTLGFTIFLDNTELTPRLKRIRLNSEKLPNSTRSVTEMSVSVSFKRSTDRIVVDTFELALTCFGDSTPLYLKLFRNDHGKSYKLDTNAADVFFGENEEQSEDVLESVQVSFFSFFPDYISHGEEEYFGSMVIDQARLSLQRMFSRMSYIGPLREEPRDFYYQDDDLIENIGNKGENAAYILAKHAKDSTVYSQLVTHDDGAIEMIQSSGTLEDAVNYWMCDVFKLGKEIRVETSKGNRYLYTVSLVGVDGTKVPITHVGFGVSQIFPVLIEGLRRVSYNKTIILEQPEIHLHPRVQSLLFDFIASASKNISFLIETHSDHFITRLRRRIAESSSDDILNETNLTFVEPVVGSVDYVTLNFNSIGSLECWPSGFFDQYESDMRALVRAQARKRKAKKQ